MKRHMRSIALICEMFLTVSLSAPGSPCFGLVSGTVTDTAGKAVSGATVTFTNEAVPARFMSATTDGNGKYQIFDAASVNENADVNDIPQLFSLGQNYPNPFNPSTVIPFTLAIAERVNLVVYNIQGQKMAILSDGYFSAGRHSVRWNGFDNRGRPVSAGLYFYKMRVGGKSETKKMLLLDGGGMSSSNSGPSGGLPDYFGKNSGKIVGSTWRVNITDDDIVPYEEKGIILTDGGIYNFSVSRRTALIDIAFVSIPGGTFQMGDEEEIQSNDLPIHSVTVQDFEMGIYEVTNAQYCAYLNAAKASGDITPSSTTVKGSKGSFSGQEYIFLIDTFPPFPDARCWITYSNDTFSVVAGHENWPVVWVTWYGSKAFALYHGFDLPTEAEWEYACRGGRQYKYGTNDGTLSQSKANYENNGPKKPVEVGSYPKNPFGLFDMSGNVWEWCHDWYSSSYYSTSPSKDPTGAQTGLNRVVRGGGWNSYKDICRSSFRGSHDPVDRSYDMGFRVVRRVSSWTY